MSDLFPTGIVAWSTAATEGTTTWPHCDDYGMATVVTIVTGQKLWVMRPKKNKGLKDAWANVQRMKVADHFDCEGVLLSAGDTL